MKEWTPNSRYGSHAFGFADANQTHAKSQDAMFADWLAHRDEVLPWIKEFSPIEHVTSNDPPSWTRIVSALNSAAGSKLSAAISAVPLEKSNSLFKPLHQNGRHSTTRVAAAVTDAVPVANITPTKCSSTAGWLGDASKAITGFDGDGTSANGWFICPDNIAFDPKGRIWIASDGANDVGIADGLYAADTDGEGKALTKMFFACPTGAEMCGPCFTPDGKTLFVAVQHPAEDSETLDKLTTRWPDFGADSLPRPTVLAITKEDGGEIGS